MLAADSGVRPARATRPPGVRRVGRVSRQRVRRGLQSPGARAPSSRRGEGVPQRHPADAGRLRPGLRSQAHRGACEAGQDEVRPGRGDQGGHSAIQEGDRSGAAGDGLVRLDRGVSVSGPGAPGPAALRERDEGQRPRDRAIDALRLGGDHERRAIRQRRAQPHRGHPRAAGAGARAPRTGLRQGLQDRPDALENGPGPRPQSTDAGVAGLVFDQHPRQSRRRGVGRSRLVQDQSGVQAWRAGVSPPAPALSGALRRAVPPGAHQLLPAAGRQ